MNIKTAGPATTIAPWGKVKSVHEAEAELKIEFEDGSTATFCLADPGSSVAVRDNPLEGRDINLMEQVNQTWTFDRSGVR